MERMTGIDEQLAEQHRLDRYNDAENGGDDDLPGRIDENGLDTEDESGLLVDRKNREHVAYYQKADGSWHPSALKVGDDVMICDAFTVRVIGPGRLRWYFAAYKPEWFGEDIIPIELQAITDRAPRDPGETPWPIVPVEEEETP